MGQELMLIRLNCCEECCGSAPPCRSRFPLFLHLRTLGVIEWSLGPFIMVVWGGSRTGNKVLDLDGEVLREEPVGNGGRAGPLEKEEFTFLLQTI